MFPGMEMGLRERKKQQTRQLIADTAWRLFADRGFEQVTVAEVARQAQVAVATVFNYFPTKEDLFYDRLEAFEAQLVEAVRARAAGEPVLVAFRRHLLESGGLLVQVEAGDAQALERLRTLHRVIAASPALQAREQRAIARTADALAALLAAETHAAADDLRPQTVANALVGVQRALLDHVRRRVRADQEPARLAADVRRLARRAFALLEHGLGDYAPGPPRPATRRSKDTDAAGLLTGVRGSARSGTR
jgi:AcrR family transcriptional regulator